MMDDYLHCEMFLWDLAALLYDNNKKLQFFEVFERLRFLAFVVLYSYAISTNDVS